MPEEKDYFPFVPLKGTLIERCIEGQWFEAHVQSIDSRREMVTIKYCDDDNLEAMVSIKDLRPVERRGCGSDGDGGRGSGSGGSGGGGGGGSGGSGGDGAKSIREPLQKPLAGLIEDDSEIRCNHRPTVTVHADPNTDEAIIINGASDSLAVGGGLRALRYLKN